MSTYKDECEKYMTKWKRWFQDNSDRADTGSKIYNLVLQHVRRYVSAILYLMFQR